MTSAFNFAKVDTSVPSLPQPSAADSRVTSSSCAAGAPLDLASPSNTTLAQLEATVVPPYPVTVNSAAPQQEAGQAKPRADLCADPVRASLGSPRGGCAPDLRPFRGTIATFSYTDAHARASAFKAEIRWGDGHRSRGRIVGSGGSFRVVGDHHFAKAHLYRARITITGPAGTRASVRSEVRVVHKRRRLSKPPRVSAGFTG